MKYHPLTYVCALSRSFATSVRVFIFVLLFFWHATKHFTLLLQITAYFVICNIAKIGACSCSHMCVHVCAYGKCIWWRLNCNRRHISKLTIHQCILEGATTLPLALEVCKLRVGREYMSEGAACGTQQQKQTSKPSKRNAFTRITAAPQQQQPLEGGVSQATTPPRKAPCKDATTICQSAQLLASTSASWAYLQLWRQRRCKEVSLRLWGLHSLLALCSVGSKLIINKTAYYTVVVLPVRSLRPLQHITSHNWIYENKLYKIFIRLGTYAMLQTDLHMYNHKNKASYELNVLCVEG